LEECVLRRLIIWAGLLTVPTAPNIAQNAPESKYAKDPRLSRLTRFFERAHSPIKHLAPDFLNASDSHSLDWRLLPSICLIETGAGRTAEKNNIFGWDSGKKAFASVREAIYLVASRISQSKLYRDKDLDHVLATYNPYPDYAAKVKSVMRQVDSSEPLKARLAIEARLSPSYGLLRTIHPAPAQ
jgi:flagellum-specific peptidoglycan hydrolase FlgJ